MRLTRGVARVYVSDPQAKTEFADLSDAIKVGFDFDQEKSLVAVEEAVDETIMLSGSVSFTVDFRAVPDLPSHHRFRLRPFGRRGGFFEVVIAENLVDMRKIVEFFTRARDRKLLACVLACGPESSGSWAGIIGIICFAREHMGVGIVAHEMAHAGFRAMERYRRAVDFDLRHAGPPFADRPQKATHVSEELYCDVVERLTRKFWREIYRRKLAEEAK